MKSRVLLIMLLSLLLMACKEGSRQPQKVDANHYVKQPTLYSKPGANLSLVNSQVNLEVSGVQYAVDIDILSGYSSGQLALSVTTSEGLYIVEGDTSPVIPLSGHLIRLPLVVNAAEAGRYYIYLHARVSESGKTISRSLTFVVQVGQKDKTSSESSPTRKSTQGREEVISIPAKEEIIRQ